MGGMFKKFNSIEMRSLVICIRVGISISLFIYYIFVDNCLFEGGVVDHTEVFSLTHVKVWSWISSKILSGSFSFSGV